MVLYSNDWKSLDDIESGITNRFMPTLFTEFTRQRDAIRTVETNLRFSGYLEFLFMPLKRILYLFKACIFLTSFYRSFLIAKVTCQVPLLYF